MGRAIPDGHWHRTSLGPNRELIRIGERAEETLTRSLWCVYVRSHGLQTSLVIKADFWDRTCSRFRARLDTPREHTTIYSLAASIDRRNTHNT